MSRFNLIRKSTRLSRPKWRAHNVSGKFRSVKRSGKFSR